MWWSEFDLQIMFAFNAYGKNEAWRVHSNSMCLMILLVKINDEFLSGIKESLNLEVVRVPMNLT